MPSIPPHRSKWSWNLDPLSSALEDFNLSSLNLCLPSMTLCISDRGTIPSRHLSDFQVQGGDTSLGFLRDQTSDSQGMPVLSP